MFDKNASTICSQSVRNRNADHLGWSSVLFLKLMSPGPFSLRIQHGTMSHLRLTICLSDSYTGVTGGFAPPTLRPFTISRWTAWPR
jgi:hypothetical protein